MPTKKKSPAKKATKKLAAKKSPAEKATKKVAKKATKKVAKKVAKKATKKVAKKATKKVAKKVAKKPSRKGTESRPVDLLPAGEMLTMEAEIPAPPEAVYDAWLDAATHTAMTGASATSDPTVGGAFSAWEGYITGRYLALFPKERIVATWRTSEFPEGAPDSQLDVLMSPHRVDGRPGTRLFLIHAALPPGGAAKYADGWAKFYFEPMTDHFS